MSEQRIPVASFSCRYAEIHGKKLHENCKLDIFQSADFAPAWNPGESKFHPKPPMRMQDRREFWLNHYRVRIDGQWYSKEAQYTLLTLQEVTGLLI